MHTLILPRTPSVSPAQFCWLPLFSLYLALVLGSPSLRPSADTLSNSSPSVTRHSGWFIEAPAPTPAYLQPLFTLIISLILSHLLSNHRDLLCYSLSVTDPHYSLTPALP